MGVVGLSLSDFMALTPKECDAVCDAYHAARDAAEHSAWERARIGAYSSVSPYFGKGKKMSPQKFLPLPWDHEKGERGKGREERSGHDNKAAIAQLAALCGG